MFNTNRYVFLFLQIRCFQQVCFSSSSNQMFNRYVAVCHPLKAKSLCTFGRWCLLITFCFSLNFFHFYFSFSLFILYFSLCSLHFWQVVSSYHFAPFTWFFWVVLSTLFSNFWQVPSHHYTLCTFGSLWIFGRCLVVTLQFLLLAGGATNHFVTLHFVIFHFWDVVPPITL